MLHNVLTFLLHQRNIINLDFWLLFWYIFAVPVIN